MVKLSDALRGAADRAPLDGVSVDAGRVTRRAAAQRGLRSGAGGVLGAGMIAVVAAGVVGTGAGPLAPASDGDRGDVSFAEGEDAAGGGAAPDIAGISLAWGLCGQELPAIPEIAGPVSLGTRLESEEAAGDALDVTVVSTVLETGTYETFGLDGVILWDGIVVGHIDGAPGQGVAREVATVDLVAGDESVADLTVPLVNCWDGEPLPAAKYELVMTQEFYYELVDPPMLEPEPEPVEPPAVDPVEEPAVDPVDEPVVDDPDATVSGGMVVPGGDPADDMVVEGMGADGATSSVAAGGPSVRVVAAPVGFLVPGPMVEDPFAAYLGTSPEPTDPPAQTEPPQPPPLPDGALDPDRARELYVGGLAGAWDMAAGSQRWLLTSDSRGTVEGSWYGCAWDGRGGFPDRSSVMDLLDVDVTAPSGIDVSYGWIVEDNPRIDAALTNTSEWDLTGFWGKDSLQLALVKDGRVVAEGYPVNPYQHQIAYAMDEAAAREAEAGVASDDAAISIYPPYDSTLAAGERVENLFLWRDVTTCWTEAGQVDLAPGTYTLLASHYVSVGGGFLIMEPSPLGDDAVMRGGLGEPGITGGLGDGATVDGWSGSLGDAALGGATDAVVPDIAIAPDYEYWDAVEFQVWTSLGQIRVR